MDNNNQQQVTETQQTQKYNHYAVVERLELPHDNRKYSNPLMYELLLLKNYELIDQVKMGVHRLDKWRELVRHKESKDDFYIMYRINLRPRSLISSSTNEQITFYDQHLGVNLKFSIEYCYDVKISDTLLFLKQLVKFKKNFLFTQLYETLGMDINNSLQSFIADQVLEKNVSIIEFNSYTQELNQKFLLYFNDSVCSNYGLEIIDFNFLNINFSDDKGFDLINKTLYEKADMELREFTYNDKVKYKIIRKLLESNKTKKDVVFVEEGEQK